jgi:hypothetical protein
VASAESGGCFATLFGGGDGAATSGGAVATTGGATTGGTIVGFLFIIIRFFGFTIGISTGGSTTGGDTTGGTTTGGSTTGGATTAAAAAIGFLRIVIRLDLTTGRGGVTTRRGGVDNPNPIGTSIGESIVLLTGTLVFKVSSGIVVFFELIFIVFLFFFISVFIQVYNNIRDKYRRGASPYNTLFTTCGVC